MYKRQAERRRTESPTAVCGITPNATTSLPGSKPTGANGRIGSCEISSETSGLQAASTRGAQTAQVETFDPMVGALCVPLAAQHDSLVQVSRSSTLKRSYSPATMKIRGAEWVSGCTGPQRPLAQLASPQREPLVGGGNPLVSSERDRRQRAELARELGWFPRISTLMPSHAIALMPRGVIPIASQHASGRISRRNAAVERSRPPDMP